MCGTKLGFQPLYPLKLFLCPNDYIGARLAAYWQSVDLSREPPRIPEEAHPAAEFTRTLRPPGILRITHRAFRVRHGDRYPPVRVAERRDARR